MSDLGSRSCRSLIVVSCCLLATATSARLARPRVAALGTGRTASFDELLIALAAATLLLGCAWATLVALSVAVEALTAGRARLTRLSGCPEAWRCWLLGLCGAALVAGAAAPTYAAGNGGGTGSYGLDGLPLPDRPAGAIPHQPVLHQQTASATTRVTGRVVVRVGDTLWHIAERDLPAAASDAQIDQLWRRINAINSRVIGPDPNLIQPGQRLWLPSATDPEGTS